MQCQAKGFPIKLTFLAFEVIDRAPLSISNEHLTLQPLTAMALKLRITFYRGSLPEAAQ
jgi:hypothetical protein